MAATRDHYSDCRIPDAVRNNLNGVFTDLRAFKARDVSDGLSKTAFASEYSVEKGQYFSSGNPEWTGPNMNTIWVADIGRALVHHMAPPIAGDRFLPPQVLAGGSVAAQHPDGVNVLFGDGSVHYFSESVSSWSVDSLFGSPVGCEGNYFTGFTKLPTPGIWQAIATRAGGEIFEMP